MPVTLKWGILKGSSIIIRINIRAKKTLEHLLILNAVNGIFEPNVLFI